MDVLEYMSVEWSIDLEFNMWIALSELGNLSLLSPQLMYLFLFKYVLISIGVGPDCRYVTGSSNILYIWADFKAT